ncbi:MAG: hypothetical protein ACXWYP_00445, partial [Pseudonocardia sp.]
MKIPSRTGVTAGVTADPPSERQAGRRRKAVVAGLVAAGLVSTTLIIPGIAAAAPPAFPNNIVVFPDRDFVTVEGYQDHIGKTATLEVIRGGQVVGSAQHVVEAGDVAFEVNHPGGACWGEGTDLKVTPNIAAGDKVVINIDGEELGDTIAGDAAVTAHAIRTGNTVTVTGTIATGVPQAQTEQRIIHPDLKDTVIGRRDVRALPGPIVPSDKGGYSSGLAFGPGNTFTATYRFDTEDAAILAAEAGGERMMSWQVEDGDGNRQGLTIAEFGELGGPGMGGCPAGPADQGAPTPGTAAVVRS